jgi:pimeloyl-ACP methyl ester carboxylesterase
MVTRMNSLLLVHGAFHGAWCWDRLRPELDRCGIVNDAVDLPFTTSEDDVAAVRQAIDRLAADGSDVTVLGHSLGGTVISAAAVTDGRPYGATKSLIFLTAIMVASDQTVDFSSGPGMAAISMDGEIASFDPTAARSGFYHRCSEEDSDWATARLRPMPTALLLSPALDQPAWRVLPSTYVVCTDDQVLSLDAQHQMAANANQTVTIDSDHSPFLSYPAELADLIRSGMGA